MAAAQVAIMVAMVVVLRSVGMIVKFLVIAIALKVATVTTSYAYFTRQIHYTNINCAM